MSISDELEKLSKLKAKGDLTEEEFGIAKALLLSREVNESSAPTKKVDEKKVTQKDVNLRLACAILMTLATVLNGISLSMGPNPMKLAAFAAFILASLLWWVSYFKGVAELSS